MSAFLSLPPPPTQGSALGPKVQADLHNSSSDQPVSISFAIRMNMGSDETSSARSNH
ncbi:hypothetical protein CC86DRAFT_369861 [Ophiobolus disseminans]|uniref:Uncharacterized protein n=1 Tax=Ophiobolus disseminans TaxID=1469910 RepID=A0A6A7A008_9PLEO|nr:hypothetical protein CC86DRAFT_369861 [Ophiobolus disseminans]